MLAAEREGGDITAAHMITQITEPSQIKQYFEDTTIFITGATGYLGKLLVEKLLRSCSNLRKIYILIRPKQDKSCEERFRDFFENDVFNRLKRENFLALQKVVMIRGDCMLPNLGLNCASLNILIFEVNCVFHCASTMRFNESLSVSALTNAGATEDLVELAKNMHNLRSFVYISSVFAPCTFRHIMENFYPSTMSTGDLLTIVNTLKEDVLEEITPILIKNWPNTYTFTKLVAEDIIRKKGGKLPIAIVRPSIVIGTVKEPVAGWVENFYSANGLFTNIFLGYVRTLQCDVVNFGDMVPADYVVNSMIAAAWDVAAQKGYHLNKQILVDCSEIPIYNYVSTPENPIRWSYCIDLVSQNFSTAPLIDQLCHIIFIPQTTKVFYTILHYLLHLVPAALFDCLRYIGGCNRKFLKKYETISKFLDGITYFTCQEWYFKNTNTQTLWKKLNAEDKQSFEFSMKLVDWDLYFHTYVRGLRVYLLQDPLETILAAKNRRVRLRVINYALFFFIFGILCYLLYK